MMDGSISSDLAKRLSTTYRCKAMGLLGSTLAAGALVALLAGRTWAAGGGNSDCAHFCDSLFGADTPEAGQCTSDAAHHEGPCYECGPAAAANGFTLCGTACCNDCETCCDGPVCGPGLSNGTCVAVPDGSFCTSGPHQACVAGKCV
jgi:hypothetical protein